MRASTTNLPPVLLGGFDFYWQADVFLDGVRQMQAVPLTNVNFDDASTSLVQGSGSCTIVYTDDFGVSAAPKTLGDVFSPFGTILSISVVVTAGPFTETILFGQYMVDETPTINATLAVFNTTVLSRGDIIDLNLQDLMVRTQRSTFDTPSSPPSLVSVWAEIQRLTQLPVTRTVTDAAIPTTVAYQQDRLQAVYDLATALDATACMTADGTVSMRPNVWPAVMDVINGGDGGTLLTAPRAMQNKTVYNRLVVQDSSGNVLAADEITSGPLRTQNADGSLSPYGRVPTTYTDPLITTVTQAQAYVKANLPRVAALRGMQVQITEVFNPLRDLGDVVTVNRTVSGTVVESFTGRVTAISRTEDRSQTTTLAVGQ